MTAIDAAPPAVRSRRRPLYALAALLALGVVVGLVVADPFGSSRATSSGNGVAVSLASVERRSLSSQTQVGATLGYADPGTIVAPGGTSQSALQQAQQSVTSAQSQQRSAEATLAADEQTLSQAQASLAADRAKLAVDCAGDGAASTGPCASDAQAVTTDRQSVVQNTTKVSADRLQVSAASASESSAQGALATSQSSATIGGQTFTWLPAVGAVVSRGQTLYAVGGQPVVLLYGSTAPWRAFAAGMTPGRDVAELNANFGLSGDAFTSATGAAIDRFQSSHGLPVTGELLLGSVVFEPGAIRVTSVTPTLGASVQPGPVLGITSTKRVVTIALDAAQQSNVKIGDAVDITLPDESTTPGRVSYVGSVATAPSNQGNGSSNPTIEVDVTPTDPAATGRLDQAPVSVAITTASVSNVLVVPVNALLALANGGYAVEVVTAGVHRLVGVQVGLFDDAQGLVQVQGSGLAPGQRVVVPAQ